MKFGWRGVCVKYSLLLINLFLFCFGVILFALGIVALTVGNRIGQAMELPPLGAGIMIMGLALAVITFFGCCGAGKENRVLLAVYFVFVILILICQLGIGIAGLVVDSKLPTLAAKAWNTSAEFQTSLQNEFYCCGLHGPNDGSRINITASPCPVSGNQAATIGCYESLIAWGSRMRHAMVAAVIFVFFQIAGCVLAFLFFKSIQKKMVDRRDLLAESRRINNFYKGRGERR